MSDHFESSLAWVLAQEGGYANLANDEVTNLGVKKSTWQAWTNRDPAKDPVSNDDMKKLTIGDVSPLYRKNYYQAALCDKLPYPFSLAVFDTAVNSGVGRAMGFLSYLSGVSLDAKMREKLLSNLKEIPQSKLTADFIAQRRDFLRRCRNFNLYGKGWLARVARLEYHIGDLLAHPEKEYPV